MSLRALVAVIALLAVVAVAAVAVTARQERVEAAPAEAAPPLVGTTLQGGPFDLGALPGRPTVVAFFASWCPSCAEEAAELAAFAAAHPEVRVVGVAVRDERADLERFVAEHALPFPIVMDEMDKAASAWGVTGIPATFFLDERGRTVASLVGPAARDQFEDALDAAR